jgi:hypothetical protein
MIFRQVNSLQANVPQLPAGYPLVFAYVFPAGVQLLSPSLVKRLERSRNVRHRSTSARPRIILGSLALALIAAFASVLFGGARAYASPAVSPQADSVYWVTGTWTNIPATHRCTTLGTSGGVSGVMCVDVRAWNGGSGVQAKPVIELYCQGSGYAQCQGVAGDFKLFRNPPSPIIGPLTTEECGGALGACSASGRNIGLGPNTNAISACSTNTDGSWTYWTVAEGSSITLPNGTNVQEPNNFASPTGTSC